LHVVTTPVVYLYLDRLNNWRALGKRVPAMMIGGGAGSELRQPLGFAIVGGLRRV
jgi:hypothetical protein